MANTTNLNLVKPAGTDKALVSVLNSNSDKIDAWAGTTNQALSYEKLTTATDFNTLRGNTKLKQYRGEDISIHTNKPSEVTGAYPFALELIPIGDNYTRQILHVYGSGTRTWKRQMYYSGGSPVWSDWVSVDEHISSIETLISGIKQTGVASGIFSLRFTNDQNNHVMALLFSSNPTSDGYKVRLYDVTDSWSIVWQVQ